MKEVGGGRCEDEKAGAVNLTLVTLFLLTGRDLILFTLHRVANMALLAFTDNSRSSEIMVG